MLRTSGVRQAEAARLIGYAQSKLNNVLSGLTTIPVGDLKMLAEALGVTDAGYIDQLLQLCRESKQPRGYWTSGHRRVYREDLRLLIDLEEVANRFRVTESEIVPGLLQSEQYVRALHEHVVSDDPTMTVEDWVQARLERQRNLVKPDAPRYHAILSESALRREYGDPLGDVMLDQLRHLQWLGTEIRNITIQVLPFSTRVAGGGMEDRFTLIRVPSPGQAGDLELAFVESLGEVRYVLDKHPVQAREAVFERLSAAALSERDSMSFISHIARTIERQRS
ncbi:helix-turn-helix transcriptional regulator [Nocardia puris]